MAQSTRQQIIDNLQNLFMEEHPRVDIWSSTYAEWVEHKFAEIIQAIELLKEKT